MALYKRNNRYWVSFTLNKVRYQLSTHEKTKVKATEVANELYNKYKDIIINKKVDFNTIVKEYLSLSHFSTLSGQTQKNYKTQLKKALEYFKNKDIFNKENIYAYIEYLINKKKLSTTTIRSKDITMLSKIFNEVKKTGFISNNPFLDLDLSSYKKTNIRYRYLSLKEKLQIQEYCINNDKQDLLDYIEFAIETGLRAGEQLNLTWDRVYLDKKEIYITETKTDINRTVPLTPLALSILNKRKNLIKPFNITKGVLHYKYMAMKKVLKLENLTWHDLRHTFASYSIKGLHSWQNNKPMPITKLQKWLGHSDIKMTMRYSHLDTEDLKNEVKESV